MTSWTIPLSRPISAKENRPSLTDVHVEASFEDQYYRIKGDKDDMVAKMNKVNDQNRILQTKCAQLEACLKKKVAANGEDPASIILEKKNKDYDDLFNAYTLIQREHRSLISKHKSSLQVIGKLKKEIQSLKLRGYGAQQNNASYTPKRKMTGGCKKTLDLNLLDQNEVEAIDEDEQVLNDDENKNKEEEVLEDTLGKLQLRLHAAEDQLQVLKATPVSRGGCSNADAEESTTKLYLMQAQQNDLLHQLAASESRVKAQEQKLQKILELHKEYKSRYEAVKKEMHLYQEENQILEIRCSELRQDNQFLENKVRVLCSTPFEIQKEQQGDSHSSVPERRRSSLVDVWQQLDHAQQQCIQKDREIHHLNQMLQSQGIDNQAQRSKIDELLTKVQLLEYQLRKEEGGK